MDDEFPVEEKYFKKIFLLPHFRMKTTIPKNNEPAPSSPSPGVEAAAVKRSWKVFPGSVATGWLPGTAPWHCQPGTWAGTALGSPTQPGLAVGGESCQQELQFLGVYIFYIHL